MALDVEELSDQTLSDIMENLETEDPGEVSTLSVGEAIDKFLIWNGIQGYTGTIVEAVDSIRAAASIQEIRTLVSPVTDVDAALTSIIDVFDEYGHLNNPTLKLIGYALRISTNKALTLLKIRELLC